jgi:cytosine/adenosine deaminase-related metal-dependent hydrolase
MGTLLLKNAALLATFDDAGREIAGGCVFIRDGVIEAAAPPPHVPANADVVIDCANLVLTPGLVNTHHHFYQTLTRAVPGAQNAGLFDWLQTLYAVWGRLDAQAIRVATATAIAELLLSGCTTAADHTYIWPNGARVDDQIAVAREMGFRFHASRGSMSLGRSHGGLPPDEIVEDEHAILEDSRRVIGEYHDGSRFAMTRIVLAPCSPFSVTPELMRESIKLARAHGVHSHTHLAETLDEERYCIEHFGCRPVELAERLGWIGDDVWHAHMVHPSAGESRRLGASQTGVAHCATSNMRLGSGIAPLRALIDAGARVGLGVDGSASNDSSDMLDEARHAMLLQRVAHGPAAFSAREMLHLATRGGAAVLGRNDIGAIAPGMAADIAGWRIDTLELAGAAVHDPLAALLFCRPRPAYLTIVNGIVRVYHGVLQEFNLSDHVARHNAIARAIFTA